MATLALAFLAGLMTILSPCVLPLAPIVIAGGRAADARGPLALAAGLALTFGVVGGALASLGVEFGSADAVRYGSAALMLLIGLVMILPRLDALAERALNPLAGLSDWMRVKLPSVGLLGQFALGAVLALAWAPCAGPTLGAAFTLAASGGSVAGSMLTMTVFALGAAAALLGAGYGLGKLAGGSRLAVGRAAVAGRYAFGALIALTGASILFGLDHRIEAGLIAAMPDWLVTFATRI
jgi:cytochrome c biogenesis protein CcdA